MRWIMKLFRIILILVVVIVAALIMLFTVTRINLHVAERQLIAAFNDNRPIFEETYQLVQEQQAHVKPSVFFDSSYHEYTIHEQLKIPSLQIESIYTSHGNLFFVSAKLINTFVEQGIVRINHLEEIPRWVVLVPIADCWYYYTISL